MTGPAAARIRRGGPAALLVPLLALGELAVDKTPLPPARTVPPSLAVRALAGGYAGTQVAGKADRRVAFALGALGAVAASYLALELRRRAGRASGLPDPVIALAEDALAIGAGLLLTA